MSGGSLNYFSSKETSTEDVWILDEVLDLLKSLDAQDFQAYQDVKRLKQKLLEIKSLKEDLTEILHDAEWCLSGDINDESLMQSVYNYEDDK